MVVSAYFLTTITAQIPDGRKVEDVAIMAGRMLCDSIMEAHKDTRQDGRVILTIPLDSTEDIDELNNNNKVVTIN